MAASFKSKCFSGLISIYRKARNKYRARNAGFRSISQREAYRLEPVLTPEIKQHYCERKGYAQLGYVPNLDRPVTYSEKLIWLALHYKNPLIAQCTDKYTCKEYIRSRLGEEYCVPALGIYDSVNSIDWDKLPEQFVLKSTAGWAGKQVIIVPDKCALPLEKTKSRMAEWLYPWNTYYYQNLCITDERIKPRILIESFLGGQGELDDFKVFCFHGKARLLLVVQDRGSKHMHKTFFDLETWQPLPIQRKGTTTAPNIPKPKRLADMIRIAETLSEGIPLLRVDFFATGERLYVGEMTFSPGMFLRITPRSWDDVLGTYIDLSKVSINNEGAKVNEQ